MQTNKKIFSFLILPILIFLLQGCMDPVGVSIRGDSTQQNNAMSKRFQDAAPKGQTAIDSAVELAKKNSELFEQMTVLRQENHELTAENRRIKDQIAVLEPELKQAKKELNEANDLLIDMTTELNNWKMQILGFQGEMRDADKAQLEILLKIAQAMGAEVTAEQENNKQSTETSSQNQPLPKERLTAGEPNE